MNYENQDFCDLIELAEMTKENYDVCEMAQDAMAKVFRYGTPEECAEALRYYIRYLHDAADRTAGSGTTALVKVG